MKTIALIFFTFLFNISLAQEIKRGENWCIGIGPTLTMNFDLNVISLDTLNNLGLSFGNSCISDTNGKLKIICNGFYIVDKNGNWIEDGDSINTPLGYKLFNYYYGDGFFNQMSIILPKKNNQYYVFTTGMGDAAYDDWKIAKTDFRFDVLSYHIVDMDANAGAGKVVSKNNILMKDARLSHNRMTAVRHANGRDWWLIKPHQSAELFYSFRITPDSIYGPFEQNMNVVDTILKKSGIGGQSCFNKQGDFYAHTTSNYNGVYVYKFDRCEGIFKSYHYFPVPKDTCYPTICDFSNGICFAPNGKYLFYNTLINIWQLDIEDTNNTSPIHISQIDTLYEYFPWYGSAYLAPNDKIYIGNDNGTNKSMGFIENPDIRGIGCNFRGRGNGAFTQPFTNLVYPPNLPFYGLGKIEGSPCDTIKPYVEPPPPQSTTLLNILIPNAFSPNGDGKNDTWHVLNIPQLQQAGIALQAVAVYNRWGNEVFKSSDINFSWDGTSLSSDTYYYYIRYRTKAGTSQVQKGSVNILK